MIADAHERVFAEGPGLPRVMESATPGAPLDAWAAEHREQVDRWVHQHGGVLFRGFGVESPASFQAAIDVLCGGTLEYSERSSPRSQVEGRVYTSTDHPPSQPIFLHNEQSYNLRFPRRIAFYCDQPAATGGATPIADCRRVLARLGREVRERFAAEGYRYVRNFHPNFGLSWQEAFQTDARVEVERYCAANHIDCEWQPDGHLRTSQSRRAVARHPVTGEESWFNHLTFFHVSTLQPAVRDFLLGAFGEADLPNNTYHGDGSAVDPAVLDELRRIYAEETVSFPWQRGDVLLLDNVLTAHGREPFTGTRRVLTAMARPTHWDDV